jgi:hypothetical protein
MTGYTYAQGVRKRRRLPYLVALWAGYHLSAIIICAFALMDDWLGTSIRTFSALVLIAMASLILGNRVGHQLAARPPRVGRLNALLILATALTISPALLGEQMVAQAVWKELGEDSAAIMIAGALFGPSLLILAAIPPYATTLLIRDRGSPGSIDGAVVLLTGLGFGLGSLLTAHQLATRMEAQTALLTVLLLSAMLCVVGLLRHPPRRITGRPS